MLKNIISFCLWGSDPKYIIGAIKNSILARTIYPDWICRFYLDKIASENSNIRYLESMSNTEIIKYDIIGDWTFNIKRFLPLSENIGYMISRDCDSRISAREQQAVNQWIQSKKTFHIMRDHPFQFNFPILAGMFGSKKILDNQNCFSDNMNHGHFSDQIFLQKYIWPLIYQDCLIHDSVHNTGLPFPTNRNNYEFIGDTFDYNDQRHPDYWKHLL